MELCCPQAETQVCRKISGTKQSVKYERNDTLPWPCTETTAPVPVRLSLLGARRKNTSHFGRSLPDTVPSSTSPAKTGGQPLNDSALQHSPSSHRCLAFRSTVFTINKEADFTMPDSQGSPKLNMRVANDSRWSQTILHFLANTITNPEGLRQV